MKQPMRLLVFANVFSPPGRGGAAADCSDLRFELAQKHGADVTVRARYPHFPKMERQKREKRGCCLEI